MNVDGSARALDGLKVCICTPDYLFLVRNGGIGTSFAHTAHTFAKAGADVVILYANDYRDSSPAEIDAARVAIAAEGCRLEFLLPHDSADLYDRYYPRDIFTVSAYLAYRELRDRQFDVIIFPDWRGLAYYCVHAKKAGIAFSTTELWVQAHSTALWHELNNQRECFSDTDVRVYHYERKSIALCDRLLSASAYMLGWMKDHGFVLPEAAEVRPLLIDPARSSVPPSVGADLDVVPTELVFFGRLERRKGLHLFVEALQRLAVHHADLVDLGRLRITFLGKIADIDGESSVLFIERALDPLGIDYIFQPSLSSDEAIAYLKARSALAVMPSLTDNSPLTVHECIQARIPFVAAATGGIPEIVHRDDHDRFLVAPNSPALADRLLRVLREGQGTARAAIDHVANRRAWLDLAAAVPRERAAPTAAPSGVVAPPVMPESLFGRWFGRPTPVAVEPGPAVSVCITHYERPRLLELTLDGLARQTFTDFHIVLVDNGSRDPDAAAFLRSVNDRYPMLEIEVHHLPDLYAGAARNHALRHVRAPLVIFMDDDNYAYPQQIETLERAMRNGFFDALSVVAALFQPGTDPSSGLDDPNYYLPAGSGLSLNLFGNSYGDANGIYRVAAVRAVGGFTEERLSWEDYELFSKLEHAGYTTGIVPEPLLCLREAVGSVSRRGSMLPNFYRALRPAFAHFPWSTYGDALLVALNDALQKIGRIRFDPAADGSIRPAADGSIRVVQQNADVVVIGRALARRLVQRGAFDRARNQLEALYGRSPDLEVDLIGLALAQGGVAALRDIAGPLATALIASHAVGGLAPLAQHLDGKAENAALGPDDTYLLGIVELAGGNLPGALDLWAGMLDAPLRAMMVRYTDLQATYGPDDLAGCLRHYLDFGHDEGREFYGAPARHIFASGAKPFPERYRTRRAEFADRPAEEELRYWLPILIANGALVALADLARGTRTRLVDPPVTPLIGLADIWPDLAGRAVR